MKPAPNFNAVWARALVDELARGGVREAVISPGSRSAPLALACAEQLRVHTVLDERAAAFFALGAARASHRPVAVLATSGSAGAHFFPAILEAEAGGVRLVALTADRPPELHGWGAPQTTDQQHLFGMHVRFFADAGVPEADTLPHLRATVARALQHDGPVHLNVPFREPLAPVEQPIPPVRDEPAAQHLRARGLPDLGAIMAELSRRPRAVVVCGPRDADDDLAGAVAALGCPVVSECASQIRNARSISHADLILRSESWAKALRPDAVIRIGGGLSSKVVQAWVEQAPYVVVLHECGEPIDPAHRASAVVEGDAPSICRALAGRVGSALRKPFDEAEARARAALERAFAAAPFGEPLIARETALAAEQLYVSSSMPVRDVDAFASRCGRVLVNRGVNGIDGIVSSAAGAAAASGKRTVALVGDVALLHDLGGLVAASRLGIPLTVVCVNNDGGGIFHFLPIADHAERFEQLFGTPHGLNLEGAATLCGADFVRVADAKALRSALQRPPALRLIEARTDRSRNVEHHRAIQQAVIDALGEPP